MGKESPDGQGSKGTAASKSGKPNSTEAVHADAGEISPLPKQSPLFHAEHADRYSRQELIRLYEDENDCRLIVMVDAIFAYSVPLFEELIHDADKGQDLHLMLHSPGGDGETAVRLARAAQARCDRLSVIVPDRAKSAGTLLAMGANQILMGPTSDLGPVDPQLQFPDGTLTSAKNVIDAVAAAEEAVKRTPETYPIHAALLSNVDALMVELARSALGRTTDLVKEALGSNPTRTKSLITSIAKAVDKPLIKAPKSHGAIFGAKAAAEAKLPICELDPESRQWQIIWRLYAKYFALQKRIYEGATCSHVVGDLNF